MESCIFCRIIKQQAPSSNVFEDEQCLVFMDIQPINPGHLLIIPKSHYAYWKDVPPNLAGHLFSLGIHLDNALRKINIKCEGVNFLAADGKAAFQEVFHAHLHVIPRYVGDGFRLQFSNRYYQRPSREELDELAAELSQQIGQEL